MQNQAKQYLIGQPREYPSKLIGDLIDLFHKIPKVNSAYLAQIYFPTTGEPPHLMISIDMSGELNDIASQLNKVMQRNMRNDSFIDVIPFHSKNFIEYMKTIDPFYKSNENNTKKELKFNVFKNILKNLRFGKTKS